LYRHGLNRRQRRRGQGGECRDRYRKTTLWITSLFTRIFPLTHRFQRLFKPMASPSGVAPTAKKRRRGLRLYSSMRAARRRPANQMHQPI
jgi:hypothetical protein